MKMKKVISIIGFIALACAFVSVAEVNTTSVSAASFAQRNHLRPYIVPKKFRGTWRRGKEVMRITRRTIGSSKALTYRYKSNIKSNLSGADRVLFVQKHGKELTYSGPQSCGMGMYRSGKNLVLTGMGCKFIYHRA